MKKLPFLLLIASFVFLILTVPASADPIGFEDLTNNSDVGSNYSGVTFENAIVLNPPSESYYLINGNAVMAANDPSDVGTPIIATFTTPTDHVSFTYTTSGTDHIFVEAIDSNSSSITGEVDLSPGQGQLYDLTSADIKYLIIHDGGHFYTVDDFTFNVAVPEPNAMLLLGTGLIGLWGLRKKFKK